MAGLTLSRVGRTVSSRASVIEISITSAFSRFSCCSSPLVTGSQHPETCWKQTHLFVQRNKKLGVTMAIHWLTVISQLSHSLPQIRTAQFGPGVCSVGPRNSPGNIWLPLFSRTFPLPSWDFFDQFLLQAIINLADWVIKAPWKKVYIQSADLSVAKSSLAATF